MPLVMAYRSRHGVGLFPILTAVFFIFLCIIILVKIRPAVIQTAEASVTDTITIVINDSVKELMNSGEMEYDDLITLEKDENGGISALVTNMAKINLLQAELSNIIMRRLDETSESIIKIPVGNLLGGTLLMGRGPSIPVNIVSLTSLETNFVNDFEAAGINQTRHQIVLQVSIVLEIVIPGYSNSLEVNSELAVAETIIVGQVPESYAKLGPGEKE